MTSERTILLILHNKRDGISEIACIVKKVLRDNKINLETICIESIKKCSTSNTHSTLNKLDINFEVTKDLDHLTKSYELILAFGGDGTLLKAAEYAHMIAVPLLGVNLGHIGFLAEAEVEAINKVLEGIVNINYKIEERMTLDIFIKVGNKITSYGWVFNEASLENLSCLGVIGVVLEIDNYPVSSFGCDGVLISTPTGSTGYAFSAGGPILWPDTEAILIVPNNAHTLFSRPIVTSPLTKISIRIESSLVNKAKASVVCDGHRKIVVSSGTKLEVSRCKTSMKLVRLDKTSFADRLVSKFRLPVRGWRGS